LNVINPAFYRDIPIHPRVRVPVALEPSAHKLSAEDCRAAAARVLASSAFQASPNLAAFLRFVVEATLSGQADRIKGYTIGTEALGRGRDFDPQTDPIVRVEAGRLRRTLYSYYANGGADDPTVIALPIGSYVPTFTRREPVVPAPPPSDPVAPAEPRPRGRLVSIAGTALAALAAFGMVHLVVMRVGKDADPAGVPDRFVVAAAQSEAAPLSPAATGPSDARRAGFAMPLVTIEPILIVGAATTRFDGAGLQQKLQNALARFDEVRVHIDPVPLGASPAASRRDPVDYRLVATLDARDAEPPQLTFRLLDGADRSVVWSKTYGYAGSDRAAEQNLLLDVMSSLAGPEGIILPNERRKWAGNAAVDPNYSCILDSYEYWRRYSSDLHERVRACLERLTAAVPNSSIGHAMLAYVYARQHYFGRTGREADVPWADRAFAAARRAVELNPNSALAFHALSGALFARNNIPQGLVAAEKAVELNPYNVIMTSGFGFRLVRVGEIERGLALLRQAAPYRSGFSSWYAFTMCVGSYLTGDLVTAAKYDLAAITDTFPPGFVASALIAAKTGDQPRARQAIDRLVALQPLWRDNPRHALEKIFHAPWMVERLLHDLSDLGLGGATADVGGSAPVLPDREVTR
jgi:tetratricopeptide (TPR) repeat protein